MAKQADKVVAIFGNHLVLKNVLDDLNQSGFSKDEISVLIKQQPDDTTGFNSEEVRTYTTATYPSTKERSTIVTETGTRTYGTPMGDIGYIDPITGLETAKVYNRDVVVDVDVEKNRLDKNIENENDVAVKDPNALMKDSMKGGALGLLAGAVLLLIPGIGPVMAAGPIAAAIAALATGAAVGTTAGALVGLFNDEGIPSDRVDTYRAAFEAGKGIVILKPKTEGDEMTELNLARTILNRHNPELVELIS